jgi:UDP-N-acetylglucosamine/UDP-N-acetylgalactosamine diphosphorylase
LEKAMHREIAELLEGFSQKHLIGDLGQLNQTELQECLLQLKRWTIEEVCFQRVSWKDREKKLTFEPFSDPAWKVSGKGGSKKCAALFLAGGLGSRLGFDGPKGCYPLLGKSLFERHCEKIQDNAPVAILTSLLNHKETFSFFEKRSFFGLQKLSFFSQDTLPLLDENGRWFWSSPGEIAAGPDGNGSVFAALERAGVLQRFEEEGIETVHVVPVDNPLANPFDPNLASFHEESGADLSLLCIRLEKSEEPMGRLVRMQGRLAIAEFAELSEAQRIENRYANTGLLAIDLPFMKLLAKQKFPLHWAWRAISALGEKRFAWKAERFIVDALEFSEKSFALCCERESCYAPLKEKKSIGEIEKLHMV